MAHRFSKRRLEAAEERKAIVGARSGGYGVLGLRTFARRRPSKYRKKTRGYRSTLARTPFPARLFTTLNWRASFLTITTAGGNGYHAFTHNGLYDPDVTTAGVGSQPTFFDNLCAAAAPYTGYIVHGSRCTVSVLNDDLVPQLYVLHCGRNVAPFTTATDAAAGDDSIATSIVGPGAGNFAYGRRSRSLSMFRTTKQILGPYDHGDVVGTYGVNPPRLTYWHLYVQNSDAGNVAAVFNVHISYMCEFFELNNLDLS